MKRLQSGAHDIQVLSHKAFERARGALAGGGRTRGELLGDLWRAEEAFLTLPRGYYDFLRLEVGFVSELVHISQELCDVPIQQRLPTLKASLDNLNQRFPATVYIPLCNATDEMTCVLRTVTEESFVFSTRERAPFKMLLEVLGTGYRWSSPKLAAGPNIKLSEEVPWKQQCAGGKGPLSPGPGGRSPGGRSPGGGGVSPGGGGGDVGDGWGETDDEAGPPSMGVASKGPVGDEGAGSPSARGWGGSPVTGGPGGGVDAGRYFGDAPGGGGAAHSDWEGDEEGGATALGQKERGVVDPRLSRLRVSDCKQLVADRDRVGSAVGERWSDVQKRVRAASPYGHLPHWRLVQLMVKSKDDVRQEQFATQLITLFSQVFRKAELPLWLRPYQVLSTAFDAGLIEMVPDTTSLHGLKKQMLSTVQQQRLRGETPKSSAPTLSDWFEDKFGGDATGHSLAQAKRRYAQSLAGYAVVCYLMQIKDRHNGNILVEQTGRIVHIDFGFMLTNSPGMISFEKAAFKLSREMVDVLGGQQSKLYKDFVAWSVAGFLEARAHARQILMLVEITLAGQPDLPCFEGRNVLEDFQDRFKLNMSRAQAAEFFKGLVAEAFDNWFTRQYDKFQRLSNGILE